MAPATEIAVLPLKEGGLDGSTAQAAHNELAQTVLRQPGCQRLIWSQEVENPGNLRWFIDWDSVDDHTKFMKTPDYKPFLERFGEILGGKPQLWHANFEPHPPSAALSITTSPATEVLHVYFPTDLSGDDAADFEERAKKFLKAVEGAKAGFTASAGGWVNEELEIPGKDDKGKAYCALIGWQSVEAHHRFRETELFKENITLLREARRLKGLHVVHIKGTEVQKAD